MRELLVEVTHFYNSLSICRKFLILKLFLQTWKIYDSGPKSIKCPLVCLPPVSGTADIFYKQVLGLTTRGIRVIAAEPPPYWNVKEWCDGFKRLIDYLELDKVHLFGTSLGKIYTLTQ